MAGEIPTHSRKLARAEVKLPKAKRIGLGKSNLKLGLSKRELGLKGAKRAKKSLFGAISARQLQGAD